MNPLSHTYSAKSRRAGPEDCRVLHLVRRQAAGFRRPRQFPALILKTGSNTREFTGNHQHRRFCTLSTRHIVATKGARLRPGFCANLTQTWETLRFNTREQQQNPSAQSRAVHGDKTMGQQPISHLPGPLPPSGRLSSRPAHPAPIADSRTAPARPMAPEAK